MVNRQIPGDGYIGQSVGGDQHHPAATDKAMPQHNADRGC
jgi:hypothetical protein